MEVRDGKQLFTPCLKPLLFLEELTLGTVTVPARVVGYSQMTARFAFIDVSTEHCGSTHLNGTHGAKLPQRERMGSSVGWAIVPED